MLKERNVGLAAPNTTPSSVLRVGRRMPFIV